MILIVSISYGYKFNVIIAMVPLTVFSCFRGKMTMTDDLPLPARQAEVASMLLFSESYYSFIACW